MKDRLAWGGLALLVLVGASGSAARAWFPADLGTRVEPYRARALNALGLVEADQQAYATEMARFDGGFAAHPRATRLHVVPGGLFLLVAPLQFSARLRARRPAVHRWTGRALLLAGGLSAFHGLYFGLLMPFGGPVESVAIALFGGLFLFALLRGFVAIRGGDQGAHREWMIRAFAVAIGISTIRVLGAAIDLALAPAGVAPVTVFLASVWLGWLLTVGAAEAWIRRTRPRVVAAASAARA